jgi:hypothetical protein
MKGETVINGTRITRAELKKMLLDSVTEKNECKTTFNEIGIYTWNDYINATDEPQTQLNYPKGRAGLGVNISNFGGDGVCHITGTKNEDGLWDCIKIYTPAYEGDLKIFGAVNEHYIGEIGIDTGEFLITDPCYLFPHSLL